MLSDKQGYTVSILITAEDMGTQQGKIGPKENQTPRGQTPNLAALVWHLGLLMAAAAFWQPWTALRLQLCSLQHTLLLS